MTTNTERIGVIIISFWYAAYYFHTKKQIKCRFVYDILTDDTDFHIFGQFGTLTADGYSNEPKSFQTSQGLMGQYYWDEYMLDDGNPAIQGMIIFDTELAGFYGVSFNMPKSVYSENKNIIDNVFQSIVIREAL